MINSYNVINEKQNILLKVGVSPYGKKTEQESEKNI
jgi:hypothetical protein